MAQVLVPGEDHVCRLVVTNHADQPLSGFRIIDDLDPLLTFISTVPAICSYDVPPGVTFGLVVTCDTSASLAQGDAYQVDLTVLNGAGSEAYPGFNPAMVTCPRELLTTLQVLKQYPPPSLEWSISAPGIPGTSWGARKRLTSWTFKDSIFTAQLPCKEIVRPARLQQRTPSR